MTAKQPARPEAATAMLKEIESYCKRTKTPEQTIGHALFRHPGFVGLLRLRLMLSVEKEAAVRQFMRAWPNGYHGDLPHMFTKAPKPKVHPVRHTEAAKLTDEEIRARQTNRDPCQRCGCRGDIGCGHSKAPLGMVL
jgi:hypothetical protein